MRSRLIGARPYAGRVRAWPAVVADVAGIVGFAVAGRRSHAEGIDLVGVGATAWPFLAGGLVGWVIARAWRRPYELLAGVVVWHAAVAIGMALRLLSGSTAQWPFVVVATLTLGLLLVGWRAAYRLSRSARRGRARRSATAGAPPTPY